jgi:hypothetical protein
MTSPGSLACRPLSTTPSLALHLTLSTVLCYRSFRERKDVCGQLSLEPRSDRVPHDKMSSDTLICAR